MENKSRYIRIGIVILIGIVAISGIAIGGHMYLDNQIKETKKAKEQAKVAAEGGKIDVERQSIVVLKQTFANIKQVHIEKSNQNEMTGSYQMFVTMTNTDDNSVFFTYSFWDTQNDIGSYGVENRNVQVKGITDKKVHVIYSDGSEADI